ncbi:MAG: hypothetical protein ABIO79_16240 [Ferruginibacter sp.]
MKKYLFLLSFFSVGSLLSQAQVQNTSYINKSGEKVLQLSITVPLDVQQTWDYFTQDTKLVKWIAPVAHIELKNGGYILTNYDKSKKLSDSSSIKLGMTSYLQNELLILKVELNGHFSKKTQEEDTNLQEIIQFIPLAPGKTKIISSMIGWGTGADWDKNYDFFVRGNIYTYEELLKILK